MVPTSAYKVQTLGIGVASCQSGEEGRVTAALTHCSSSQGAQCVFLYSYTVLLGCVVTVSSDPHALDLRGGESGLHWAWFCGVMGQQRRIALPLPFHFHSHLAQRV